MFYVYVLKNQQNICYKGFTLDLERRIKEHNQGQCQTTKHLRPFDLVFVQLCENRQEARSLEKYLKSGSGREIIREICMPPW